MKPTPEMFGTTILECVVGSNAHGTAVADGLEDLDLMRIVVEDIEHFAGFAATDTVVWRTKPDGVRSEAGDTDLVCYGLRKYLKLALKGNPTLLLALFVSQPRDCTAAGLELQQLASAIVSRQVYMPFRGYMHDQHKRLLGTLGQKNVTRPELVEKFGFDTKYAAHIVRLAYQGIELLHTGRISLPMPQFERKHVVDVRNGRYTLQEVDRMITALTGSLDHAHAVSKLPERPQTSRVERWMIDTYMQHWGRE